MSWCKCSCGSKCSCLASALVLTGFYGFALFEISLTPETGVFNTVALMLGITLLVAWAAVLSCRHKIDLREWTKLE